VNDNEHLVRQIVTELNRRHRACLLADSPDTSLSAEAAYEQFWSDPHLLKTAKDLHDSGAVSDPQAARHIRLIYWAARDFQAHV
jgi:hypothetical protein